MDAKTLCEVGEGLFTKRSSLMLLWQEQAENFYPERADFTYRRSLGTDFASNLMSSYPLMCRRELGDQVGVMLRPTAKEWFKIGMMDQSKETNAAKRWLEWASGTMRRAMYDKRSRYTRASKEGDHDFSAFGQSVKQVRMNRNRDALLYQTHHLRDMAWQENEEGGIGMIFRKWKPTARDLKRLFGDKVHSEVNKMLDRNTPNAEIDCMHIMVEADLFDDPAMGRPYWSIYYDVTNKHSMESVPVWSQEYNISRWQTVSGSQYAFSPATIAALPDARLIQSMTYTLLEAGEKATNPPMVATDDVVKSDLSIYAGGVTWVDRDYDERLGDALRPLTSDKSGIPFGEEMLRDSREMVMQAFYLNKLNLPQRAPEMTAYEIGQRVQEYIRGALPIFEPMEMECNGNDCELTFDLMLRNGAFGSPDDMPRELRGQELQFRFESPLHDAIEQAKGQRFLESAQYIATAVQLDPTTAAIPDAKTALRDVLMGIGSPAKWLHTEADVERTIAAHQQQQEQQQLLATMQQGSEVVGNLAAAQKDARAAA